MPGAAAQGSEPQTGPAPGSVAPESNPSPVQSSGSAITAGAMSPNYGESLGPRNMISQSVKNPSPVEPLARPLNQGHVMSTTMPWLEMPHNPQGQAFQRPLEEF